MLEINIDDTTDMNEVKEMVRKYYLEHNIVSNNKPKQPKTKSLQVGSNNTDSGGKHKKTKTKQLPIGDNNTDSLDKEYIEIDGFIYCHLDFLGYKGYYICREDGCIYRESDGELIQKKSTLWNPPKQRKSPALVVNMFNGYTHTTKQVKTLYATCFVPNPFGLKYVETIDGDYSNISIDNLRWTCKRPRG